MIKEITLLCMLFLLLLPAVFGSAEQYEISLKDAISIAVQENLDIKIEGYIPQIRKTQVEFEEGDFDAQLQLKHLSRYRESQTATVLAGTNIAIDKAKENSIVFKQKIKTGMEYLLRWNIDRFDVNSSFVTEDPRYEPELVLEVRQPVLRGRGIEVQEANINIAKNDYQVSMLDLDRQIRIVMTDVEKLYWDLVNAYEELGVAKLALKLAKTLYEVSKARIEAGTLAPIEILQSEAEIARREKELIEKEKIIRDKDDELKEKMNFPQWEIEFKPIDAPPTPRHYLQLDSEIAEALEKRIDLKTAILNRKSEGINVKLAKNTVLPELSFVGSVGIKGLNENFGRSMQDQFSTDYYSWKAGLVFNVHIGNRIAKSNLVNAEIREKRAGYFVSQTKQKVIVEVREAVRAVEVALKQINASIKSEALARKRLENEEEKFKIGMSTAHDVLEFQEAYAVELSGKHKAVIDYANSLAELRLIKRVSRERLELRQVRPVFRGLTRGERFGAEALEGLGTAGSASGR